MSSHRFLCLPLRHPHWSAPCRIVLASLDDHVTCSYHFSLHFFFTEVRRSSHGPMAFPILAFTSSLVIWFLYYSVWDTEEFVEMSHLQCLYPFNVCCYDLCSHAYKNMDMTRERISLILELMVMFLSFQMTFSLITAAVVWAIMASTSGLDPSSNTTAPRHLKLWMVSSFLLSMVMSVLMPLVLFAINWVFSALICMP